MRPVFTFIGHASLKFKTSEGAVIYVDPFFHGDYSEKADILLVTHNHRDHNAVGKVSRAADCLTVMPGDALSGGVYQSFSHRGVQVDAVEAYNKKHDKSECVGYVLSFDGLKIYCAGDTSKTEAMSGSLSRLGLDYALLPIDGVFNMGPEEASECARLLNTRRAIPIHNAPLAALSGTYSAKGINKFTHPGKLVLKYGESVEL